MLFVFNDLSDGRSPYTSALRAISASAVVMRVASKAHSGYGCKK